MVKIKFFGFAVGLTLLFGCAGGNQDMAVQEADQATQNENIAEIDVVEEVQEDAQAQQVEELPAVVVVEPEPGLVTESQETPIEVVVETADEPEVAAEVVESVEVESVEVEAEAEVADTDEPEAPAVAVQNTTLQVNFVESAPKDRFVIENSGSCTLNEALVTIDLAESAGKLIFDTTGEGAGVEVFQPFEIAEGQLELVSSREVIDGDTALTVRIQSLQPGSQVGFTIDVDDTLTNSDLGMIRVTGSEISGGAVLVSTAGQEETSAVFGDNSRAATQLACG